ncbi:MAG: hypothetical protein HQ522_11385 [Bacteroidetes bacterium]|nr:hypothetical protein [Bacteroidota bacterium]
METDEKISIRFSTTWINVDGKRCEISELKNIVEKRLPVDGSQREVELVVYSTSSKERVDQIYAELGNIEDLEIIRKDVTPPPPPLPMFRVYLYKNKVSVQNPLIKPADKEVPFSEVSSEAKKFMSEAGEKSYANIYVEDGVAEDQIQKMKESLLLVGIKNIKVRDMK